MTNEPQLEYPPRRVNVLGVGIHATAPREAVVLLEACVGKGKTGYVCVTGVHGIMESQRDAELKEIHNRSLLTVPDGMPTVWVGRLKGHYGMRRTYGPDLMMDICEVTQISGHTHYFFGGQDGVADALAQHLKKRFPGLCVVGTHCPPFRPMTADEEKDLTVEMDRLRPDYFWVGLSTPKQERFMAMHTHLNVRVMVGVGAAFNLHTGRMADAPRWIKACGLQWCHRLFQEPRRLGRRYLVNNPKFLWKILLQMTGLVKYSKYSE